MIFLEITGCFCASLCLGLIIQFIVSIDVARLEDENRQLLAKKPAREIDPVMYISKSIKS